MRKRGGGKIRVEGEMSEVEGNRRTKRMKFMERKVEQKCEEE